MDLIPAEQEFEEKKKAMKSYVKWSKSLEEEDNFLRVDV